MVQCSLCGRDIRVPSAARGACAECGARLCFYCVMIDGATHCRVHRPPGTDRPAAPERVACAVCGKWPVTPLDSAECGATGCRARVCDDCLAVGSRLCPTHAAQAAEPEATAPSGRAPRRDTCAFCGAVISDTAASEACTSPGCRAVICAACAELGHDRCGQHLREFRRHRKGLRNARGRAEAPRRSTAAQPAEPPALTQEPGPQWYERRAPRRAAPRPPNAPAIDSARARLAVEDFLGRFAAVMAQPRQVLLPTGDMLRLPGWDAPTARWNDRAAAASEGATNLGEWYEYAPRRWLGLGRGPLRLLVEARSYVRTERYLDSGSDWEPVSADELAPLLVQLSDRAREGQYFHLLSLASPTGWSDDAKELVAGAGARRGLALPGLRAVLCDPHSGDCWWNELDTRADELSGLFPLVSEAERDADRARGIEALLVGRSGIDVDEAVLELGCSQTEAERAFELLAKGRDYEALTERGRPKVLTRRGV